MQQNQSCNLWTY